MFQEQSNTSINFSVIPHNYFNIHFNSNSSSPIVMYDLLKFANTFIDNNKNLLSTGYTKTKNMSLLNEGNKTYEPNLLLHYGIHKFKFDYNNNYFDMYISFQEQNRTSTIYEIVTISAENLDILKHFMDRSLLYKNNNDGNNKITIKILKKSSWITMYSVPKRSSNTIFSNFDLDELCNNITNFINSENVYVENGIPHKLNILFHGIPGSGKTSIIKFVASYFNMDICFLTLSKELNDENFMDAVSNIPVNYILVIEEIDTLFTDRNDKKTLSFSTFINVLDGFLQKNKLITFLTTNHKQLLDQALFRMGRINYEYEFTHVTNKQLTDIFNSFFNNQNDILEKLLKFNKYNKINCSTIHNWCFYNRDNNSLEKSLEVLEDYIKNNNTSHNDCMYI